MDRWKGKVAVVTGASVGIGAEISTRLADLGIIVVGLARRDEMIKGLSTSGTIHAVKCDLTNEHKVVEAFRWIEKHLGGVDILINNAGVLKMSSLLDGNTKDWKDMLELNVVGLSICTREALKSMRTKLDGHIIHINSVTGHNVPQMPELLFGPYSASKFAVTSLTESLRIELQKTNSNIKITSISPGPVDTDMLRALSTYMSINDAIASNLRLLETRDIADAVLYALGTRLGVEVSEIILQPQGILAI